jgi:hypothetical protein
MEILDHDFRRATPSEWSNYCVCKEMIRILNRQMPKSTFDRISSNSYTLNRPLRLRFFDNSRTKVGRQCFENKIVTPSSKLTFDWSGLTNDQIRVNLKQCLFKYPSSACSSFVTDKQTGPK